MCTFSTVKSQFNMEMHSRKHFALQCPKVNHLNLETMFQENKKLLDKLMLVQLGNRKLIKLHKIFKILTWATNLE